jgi:DNA polymerase III alpha subunit (gram-positive type)
MWKREAQQAAAIDRGLRHRTEAAQRSLRRKTAALHKERQAIAETQAGLKKAYRLLVENAMLINRAYPRLPRSARAKANAALIATNRFGRSMQARESLQQQVQKGTAAEKAQQAYVDEIQKLSRRTRRR